MLLIKNCKIVDGSGKPSYKGDILISGDRISAINAAIPKTGLETIDAIGLTVTPGFIDPNTDSDHYLTLFNNPSQSDFLLQGVTTIIGGHCGASLAPLLYGSLESIRKWVDTTQVNIDWHTVGELFQILNKKKLGVNFGTLVGYSTIRRAIIGEAQRDLTDNEILVFEGIVEKALDEGALGVSTGLGYAHSSLISQSEISRILKVVAKHNGVHTTHLRNENAGLLDSIKEIVQLTELTNVKTLISHLRPLIGFENDTTKVIEYMRQLDPKLDLHFDTFPFDASFTPIYTLLPDWAKRGNLEYMWNSLTRSGTRDQIKKEINKLPLDKMLIAVAPNNKYLIGKTIAEFARNQGVVDEEALIELMILTRMKAILLYKNINLKFAEDLIFEDRGLVGSNSASLSYDEYAVSPERGLKTFPRFIELASKRKNYPIESAIKKITHQVAKKFDLKNRGLLKEGYIADITMLDNNKVINVIVNGQIAVENSQIKNASAGQIVKNF